MGQGCCLSLIAANARVAIEFLMLQHKVPKVEKSAFIDDRTLDTGEAHYLEAAIKEVVKMDQLMAFANLIPLKIPNAQTATMKRNGIGRIFL